MGINTLFLAPTATTESAPAPTGRATPLNVGAPFVSFAGGRPTMITPIGLTPDDISAGVVFSAAGATYAITARTAANGLSWRVTIQGRGTVTARTAAGNLHMTAAAILRKAQNRAGAAATATQARAKKPIKIAIKPTELTAADIAAGVIFHCAGNGYTLTGYSDNGGQHWEGWFADSGYYSIDCGPYDPRAVAAAIVFTLTPPFAGGDKEKAAAIERALGDVKIKDKTPVKAPAERYDPPKAGESRAGADLLKRISSLPNNAYKIGVLAMTQENGGDIEETARRTGVSASLITAIAGAENPAEYVANMKPK